MFIHKKLSDDGTHWEYRTERQHWVERFVVEVDGRLARSEPGMVEALPWYLRPVEYNPVNDVTRFWAIYLIPLVWLRHGITQIWYYPSRLCYRAGWFDIKDPGEVIHWFWPRYLKIWTIWKKK